MKIKRYDFAACAAFTAYAGCSLIIPIVLVAMGKDLNFPLDDGGMGSGGILHLARCAAMLLSLLGCGFVAAKFGKRLPMGTALLIMGLGITGCAFAPGYWMLIPMLTLAGLGEGICEGLATPFVQDLHPDNPEKHVNIAHSFWSVGISICVLGAGFMLLMGISWRVAVFCYGLSGVLVSLCFLWKESAYNRYPENPVTQNTADICRLSVEICKSFRFWLFCAGMFVGAGAEFCLTFWSAAYLELTFKASPLLAGCGTAAIAAGMFVGRNFFAHIASVKNLKNILLACSLGTIPLTLMLAFLKPAHFSSPILMFTVLLTILFLCGIGIAPYWPTLQVYGVRCLPHLDSTMLYIYFSAMGIPGCGFFTWIIGVLGDNYGLQGAFILIPATLLLYAGIILCNQLFCKKENI